MSGSKLFALVLAATSLAAATPAVAQDTVVQADARYSVKDTKVGKLLDDPATAAILKRMIPTVYANDMFQSAGRDLTLLDIQQYEPEALNNDNLAKIQAEFDRLPKAE